MTSKLKKENNQVKKNVSFCPERLSDEEKTNPSVKILSFSPLVGV